MRFAIWVLALAALLAQSVVATPRQALAQSLPPEDAVAISIAEVTPPVEGDGVTLPVTIAVDPDAGLDQTVPLVLRTTLEVDSQPLADLAIEAASVALTTSADGVAEVSVSDLGSWEALTSVDGLPLDVVFAPPAGTVGVTLQVLVPATETEPESAVSPPTSYSFDVEPAGETLATAIRSDYEQGVITADEAARTSLASALDPTYRDEQYADLYDDAIPEDPQALGLLAVSLYPELSKKTTRELQDEYFEASKVRGKKGGKKGGGTPEATQEPSVAAAAPPPAAGPVCDGIAPFPCTLVVDGAPRLEFRYEPGNGASQVPSTDDDGNQIPDTLDLLIARFREAAAFYGNDLGMRAVDHTIVVWLVDSRGVSLPAPAGGGSIQIPPDASDYLVRHELFHQVEYEYLSIPAIIAHYQPMYWLIEAAAEWATYQAQKTLPTSATGLYAASLPAALARPHTTLDDTDQWVGGPEYGSFPFFEYLQQQHGGIATVERVLIDSGGGIAGRRPTDVIADLVPWEQAIVEYRQWTYLLERDATYGVGFSGNAVGSEWRAALQADPRTRGSSVASARPRRTLERDVSARQRFSETGVAAVFPGGARYYEFVLPQNRATAIDIELSTDSDVMQASAILTGSYPTPCQDLITQTVTAPTTTIRVDAGAGCDRFTLAIVNTGRPGDVAGVVDWTVRGAPVDDGLEVDGDWRTLQFTDQVREHRLTFQGDAGQRLRVASRYTSVWAWFYVLGPDGNLAGGYLPFGSTEPPDVGLPSLPTDGEYTLVVGAVPDDTGELDVRVYDQVVDDAEFYATYEGDVGVTESWRPLPWTDPTGDAPSGDLDIVGLDARFANDRVRVEVTLSDALTDGPDTTLNLGIDVLTFGSAYGHGPALAGSDTVGVWNPTGGPCNRGAGWSQSGLTYIYETDWSCDIGADRPLMTVAAFTAVRATGGTQFIDFAPDEVARREPWMSEPSTAVNAAGPVPTWGILAGFQP